MMSSFSSIALIFLSIQVIVGVFSLFLNIYFFLSIEGKRIQTILFFPEKHRSIYIKALNILARSF